MCKSRLLQFRDGNTTFEAENHAGLYQLERVLKRFPAKDLHKLQRISIAHEFGDVSFWLAILQLKNLKEITLLKILGKPKGFHSGGCNDEQDGFSCFPENEALRLRFTEDVEQFLLERNKNYVANFINAFGNGESMFNGLLDAQLADWIFAGL
jgi:hypothetical protein